MSTRALTSVEEFERICDQLGPCELVRGEVVILSPSGLRHSQITANVTVLLSNWAKQRQRGRVFSGEAGVIVETDPDTVRGADVAYYSYQRLPRGAGPVGFSDVPPDLVVEIIGQGQGWSDLLEKAGEYLRMGVDRVWVIDPDSRRLHVFRPDTDPLVVEEQAALHDEATLPGFSCRVSQFFED